MKPIASNIKSLRLIKEDFEIIKVIGRGAFGEVCVVKMRGSDKVPYISCNNLYNVENYSDCI